MNICLANLLDERLQRLIPTWFSNNMRDFGTIACRLYIDAFDIILITMFMWSWILNTCSSSLCLPARVFDCG